MGENKKQIPLATRLGSNLFRAPCFFLGTGLFGSLSLLASCFESGGRVQHRIARAWAKVSLFIAGAPVEVIGRENLRPAAIYASNHTSFMDTPVIFSSLPFQFRILAKRSLWKWPFIGWHLRRSGQIPVDEEGVTGLSRALQAVRAGMPLFIFPEGGRTEDGELQPFMNGPAFLALRAQVPIVPVALIGTYRLLPTHGGHFVPGPVRFVAGTPIETVGRSVRQAGEVTAELRSAIAELCEQYGRDGGALTSAANKAPDRTNI